jgi:hypothetical protein
MIQATVENKYCFNMRVSAAPMANTKRSRAIEPEAGASVSFCSAIQRLEHGELAPDVFAARLPAYVLGFGKYLTNLL